MNNLHRQRLSLLFFIFLGGYGILLANLALVQLYQSSFFTHLGKQQYRVTVSQLPPRGLILDCKGRELALNTDSLAAFITPRTLKNREAVMLFLAKEFPAAAERLANHPDAHFMYVKRRLTTQEKELIDQAELEDICYVVEPSRYYPFACLSTVVGITNTENEGIVGVELIKNRELAGKKTTFVLEKDARAKTYYFHKAIKEAGVPVQNIHLTLDADVQFMAYTALKEAVAHWGASEGGAVVVDPLSGGIIALAHYPCFDPHETYSELPSTKNPLVSEVHELGSVMKTFLALSALAENVLTPDDFIDCENKKTTILNGITINTWKAHGLLSFSEVIEFSNNIGTSKVALKVGKPFYDHYKKCGFGSKTGCELPGEQVGFVNPPRLWTKPSLFSLSFGYEISATLAQLARSFAILARGGSDVRLTLFAPPAPQETPQLYPPELIETLKAILQKTVTHGTAHAADVPGYTVWGKTGTANCLVDGAYQKDRNLFTFAGVIEKGDYKRVIVTFIKHANKKNIYASSVAAPLFNTIAHNLVVMDKIVAEEHVAKE